MYNLTRKFNQAIAYTCVLVCEGTCNWPYKGVIRIGIYTSITLSDSLADQLSVLLIIIMIWQLQQFKRDK